MKFYQLLKIILISLLVCANALAVNFEEYLPDEKEERRAQIIFKNVRCIACAGESIHDSGAKFASDLRAQIRSEISLNKTDDEILNSLVDIYGERILMETDFSPSTALLWLLPIIFLAFGIMGLLKNVFL